MALPCELLPARVGARARAGARAREAAGRAVLAEGAGANRFCLRRNPALALGSQLSAQIALPIKKMLRI